MSTIQAITDTMIISALNQAKQRVVVIAPGVWTPLAQAIADAWFRLGPENVTVVLDVDPEICRIGYGSIEALKTLQKTAQEIGESLATEPGIRICVFIIDDLTFVFSPTPRQLEAPSEDCSGTDPLQSNRHYKTNGIVLNKPIPSLENDLGAGPDGIITRTLGMELLNNDKLASVKKDLEINPPKNFDLSRAVNVYNAKIQFVELKVVGCRLSSHRALLPQHLLHVIKNNPKLSATIANSIQLLKDDDVLVTKGVLSEKKILELRDSISKKYLKPIKGIGLVIERSQKNEFGKEVAKLKDNVDNFSKVVEKELAERYRETAEKLAKELKDDLVRDPPPKWERRLRLPISADQVYWLTFDDLINAFGDPSKRIEKMNVETIFKDVTYEMLNDPAFREDVAGYFPELQPLEEYSAARERNV